MAPSYKYLKKIFLRSKFSRHIIISFIESVMTFAGNSKTILLLLDLLALIKFYLLYFFKKQYFILMAIVSTKNSEEN